MDAPETQYAKTNDDLWIAYQTVGEGPIDLIVVNAWITHVEIYLGTTSVRAHADHVREERSGHQLRQARHRSFGSDQPGTRSRIEDGRYPCGDGCRRQRSSRALRMGRWRGTLVALRRDLSGASGGADPLRRRRADGMGA